MDEAPPTGTARSHLHRAIKAHDANDPATALAHVIQALKLEPDNEIAWLWMAEFCDRPEERLYCLGRAVAINPDSPARRTRDRLLFRGVSATPPESVAELAEPALPSVYQRTTDMRASRSLGHRLRSRLHRLAHVATNQPADHARPSVSTHHSPRWSAWAALLCGALAVLTSLLIVRLTAENDAILIAVVGPMTGPESDIGLAMSNGAAIAAADFNRTTKGAHIRLLFFDDQGDPSTAATVAQTIADDPRIVGVIGHGDSTESLAAAPIYQRAGIPAITAQSTSDELTAYPEYFRTIFSNRTEGIMLATYLHDVMKQDRVSIVTGQVGYEQELTTQFTSAFQQKGGTIVRTWTISDADPGGSIQQIVAQLKADPNAGAVLLSLTEHHGYEFLLASRRAGVDPAPMIASESIGSDRFAALFAGEPEETKQPGFFTDDLYAVSPLIYDAVSADALAFEQEYEDTYGTPPGWRPAKTWDAVTALATAADRADITPRHADGETDIAKVRAAIAAQLHAIDSPDTSFRGLAGPFYFTTNGDSPQGFSIGQFLDGQLSSAPTQYRLVTNTTQYDMAEEVASGRAVKIDDFYVRQYRVVYIGIEMIELRDLDLTAESFTADFFIAFRYNGSDDAYDIMFPNATSPDLDVGEPIATSTTKTGMHYAYFRVQGTFNTSMNFRDYPWDRHQLAIRFQNPHLTQNDIVYVTDPSSEAVPMDQRLTSSFDQAEPFNSVPNWTVDQLLYTQASVTTTAESYDTEGFVQYSEFRVVIGIHRNVHAYLVKNLMPLLLLSLVTYIALWFPPDQAGARVGFAVTALLSSSVMLNTISGQLPDIGYTVAIEWGFYVYIALSALVVMTSIAVGRSYKDKRMARVQQLDVMLRIVYPAVIIAVVLIYWWTFYGSARL